MFNPILLSLFCPMCGQDYSDEVSQAEIPGLEESKDVEVIPQGLQEAEQLQFQSMDDALIYANDFALQESQARLDQVVANVNQLPD